MPDDGGDGVVDVVGISSAADAAFVETPGAGNELERSDCSVIDGVAIETAVIGVTDECCAVTSVEGNTDDWRGN